VRVTAGVWVRVFAAKGVEELTAGEVLVKIGFDVRGRSVGVKPGSCFDENLHPTSKISKTIE
jgi:hypothetical protein